MRKFRCKQIIFSSTAAIFGEPKYSPINENHPKAPINAYGDSKLMFERILYWYHLAYGFRVNLFRYFCAAGASKKLGEAHKNESHLIPLAIDTALGKRETLYIYGNNYPTKDGTGIRDFIHVLDIARAHILALDNLEPRPYEAYNLGCGVGYSVKEVIDMVEKVSGQKVNYEVTERRIGDPAVLVASYDKVKRELGWEPEFGLEDMVQSALQWHSSRKN